MWDGRRKEERRGCADTSEEPRTNRTHQCALPVSTAARGISIRDGLLGAHFAAKFLPEKALPQGTDATALAWQTAPGGHWLAEPLQGPTTDHRP